MLSQTNWYKLELSSHSISTALSLIDIEWNKVIRGPAVYHASQNKHLPKQKWINKLLYLESYGITFLNGLHYCAGDVQPSLWLIFQPAKTLSIWALKFSLQHYSQILSLQSLGSILYPSIQWSVLLQMAEYNGIIFLSNTNHNKL